MLEGRRPINCVASLVLLAGIGGCVLLRPEPIELPALSLQSLELETAGFNRQMFRAGLRLFNPNTVPLDVTRVSLKLTLAGVEVATATTLAPFLVDPGEHRVVDLRVTTNLLRDAPALFTVLTGSTPTNGLEYRLRGHIDLVRRGRDRVPVSAAGRLHLPGESGGPVL